MAAILKIRFQRHVKALRRPTTSRRIKAAERHLAKVRERFSLFEAEVAAEQPTPEERIQNFEDGQQEFWRNIRDSHAQTWRRCRAWLIAAPESFRLSFLTYWNERWIGPRDAGYFATMLRKHAIEAGLQIDGAL